MFLLRSWMGFEDRYRQQHKGASFFGFADPLIDTVCLKDALEIVAEAAKRTVDDDLRGEEPFLEALGYVEARTGETALITRLRRSLSICDPMQRAHHVAQLVRELERRHGRPRPAGAAHWKD